MSKSLRGPGRMTGLTGEITNPTNHALTLNHP